MTIFALLDLVNTTKGVTHEIFFEVIGFIFIFFTITILVFINIVSSKFLKFEEDIRDLKSSVNILKINSKSTLKV